MGANAASNQNQPSPQRKYIPWLVETVIWNPDRSNTLARGIDKRGMYVHHDAFKQAQADLKRAHDFGVKIMAGTDSTDTDVYAGASLHDELAMMVDAGLSPAEALRTATVNPAIYAGQISKAGTIDVGKRADLILLNANPLSHISNTREIESVFVNGQHLSLNELVTLKRSVEKAASSVGLNLHLLWDMITSPLWRVQLMD